MYEEQEVSGRDYHLRMWSGGELSGRGYRGAGAAFPSAYSLERPQGTCQKQRSVLEAESEKLMKLRMRAEQVKKEKEENRAAKQ